MPYVVYDDGGIANGLAQAATGFSRGFSGQEEASAALPRRMLADASASDNQYGHEANRFGLAQLASLNQADQAERMKQQRLLKTKPIFDALAANAPEGVTPEHIQLAHEAWGVGDERSAIDLLTGKTTMGLSLQRGRLDLQRDKFEQWKETQADKMAEPTSDEITALRAIHPEILKDDETAAAYIRGRRRGLMNQLPAPKAGYDKIAEADKIILTDAHDRVEQAFNYYRALMARNDSTPEAIEAARKMVEQERSSLAEKVKAVTKNRPGVLNRMSPSDPSAAPSAAPTAQPAPSAAAPGFFQRAAAGAASFALPSIYGAATQWMRPSQPAPEQPMMGPPAVPSVQPKSQTQSAIQAIRPEHRQLIADMKAQGFKREQIAARVRELLAQERASTPEFDDMAERR